MSNLKKALYIGASAALVLSGMVGLLTAHAATISDGDLVKVAGNSAVYYIQGNTARVFPHANVFASWGLSYSAIKTITANDLAAYNLGGNPMPFRDGSLFRGISTGLSGYAANAVYYVWNGRIMPVVSSSVYQALFKDPNWKKVTWVPDDLLAKFNYPVGVTITSSSLHPDGSLVKYTATGTKYLISGGAKRAFSSTAAFTANHYLAANVITIDPSEIYADGDAITGAEAGLMSPAWVGPENQGSGLMIADGGSPAAQTIPGGSMNVNLVKVRLTAGSTDVLVNGMTFSRTDIGAYSEWTSLYLYQGNTRITASGRTLSTSNTVSFPSLNITIPANSSQTITLRGDLGALGTSTTGSRHVFTATAVTTSATVTGLPVQGNVVMVGSQSVGTVTVSHGSSSTNPTVGAKGAEVLVFKIQNTGSTDDVTFNQVVFHYDGTMNNSDLTNLKLYVNGETTVLASAAAINSDDTVTLTLANPYTIAHGVTKTFVLDGDLSGRVSDYFGLYIDSTNASGLVCTDTTFNTGAVVTVAASIDAYTDTELTLQGGTVSVAQNGPIAGNVGVSTTGLVLTKFAMTSQRDVEVRKIGITLDSNATSNIDGTLSNLQLIDTDTGMSLESHTLAATTSTWATTYTLTTAFDLTANVTRNLAVTVDIGSDTNTYFSSKYLEADIVLSGTSYVYDTGSSQYLDATSIVPNTLTGYRQTVQASSLTEAIASVPVSQTVTKGTSGANSLGITYTSSNSSAINIRQVKARIYASTTTTDYTTHSIDPSNIITSVYLYDNDTNTLLATKNITAGGSAGTDAYGMVTFSGLNVTVPAGGSKTLGIKVDLNSSPSVEHWYYAELLGSDTPTIGYDANSTERDGTDNVNTGPTVVMDVKTAGTLTLSQDASTPNSGIVIAGANNVVLAKIKFAAAYEQFTVSKFRVLMSTTSSASSISRVTITPEGGTPQTMGVTGGHADFSNINWVVPANSSKVLTISANLSTIDPNNVTSGRDLKIGIDGAGTSSTFQATGASQTTLTASTDAALESGNDMYVRQTQPTVSLVALGSSALVDGTMTLYKFNVAADAAHDLTLKKVKFNVIVSDNATSSALQVTSWQLYDASNMGTALNMGWSSGSVTSSDATTGGAVPFTNGSGSLYARFHTENVIPAGSSKTFVLKGTVSSSAQYDSIITRLSISNDAASYTGYLINDVDATLLTIYDNTLGAEAADMLWSDESYGVNHTDGYGTSYPDWTTGYLVNTLPTDYQSLSR